MEGGKADQVVVIEFVGGNLRHARTRNKEAGACKGGGRLPVRDSIDSHHQVPTPGMLKNGEIEGAATGFRMHRVVGADGSRVLGEA